MAAHEPSESFWTLTRPSKNLKKHHDANQRTFNISVVGVSGTERDKGPIGIGKSCFCNRFIKSAADDYHADHISVLSQSDFSGRVVNNDHWLYWGSVIKSDEGVDLTFNVIEQTEFVDDSCFQPFKSGKTEPYHKRCSSTRLISAEKLMYICKNQLGIEKEYEQKYLPDGKFNVDGFLCLFDVSDVQGRSIERHVEMTTLILMNLIKTKKPIVLVTTKHDESSEMLVLEAERLVSKREFRGSIPLVETSALENVNVNLAFILCSQLIDRTRGKVKIIPYFEAYRHHKDLLDAASDAYLGLIRSTVIDYRSSWQQVCMKLSHNPEFLQYTYLHGLDKAMSVFRSHIRRLRDDFTNRKVQIFMKLLPGVLNQLTPQINASGNYTSGSNEELEESWKSVKAQLRSHPHFERFFVETTQGIPWQETDLIHSGDTRIAADWLDSREAKHVYHQILMCLNTKERKLAARDIFSQMLNTIHVPLGQPFTELKALVACNESLSPLNDQDLFEIYADYQRRALDKARSDFQELLSENAEHLHHLTSTNRTITQDDIITINSMLQHDERYQALEKFDQERTLMIIRHLSFIHSPVSEQCPSFPYCVEPAVERLLLSRVQELVSRSSDNKKIPIAQENWSMVIIGPRRPSQQLILALNVLNSRSPKPSQISMNFIVLDTPEEVDSHLFEFKQLDYKPKGCLCIYTNKRSLDHVAESLEKFLSINANDAQHQDNRPILGNPPVVMLYAADIGLDERNLNLLEAEGQAHASNFHCPFMNVTALDQYRHHQQNNILKDEFNGFVTNECASLDYGCVDGAFNVLKEAISKRICLMKLYANQELLPRQAFNPDVKILMCVFCGEPYPIGDIIETMFLNYKLCYITSAKSLCVRMMLNNEERFVEIIITSYTHGALSYRDDLLHGFILLCSTRRKASLAIMNAFSFNIPCTPIQIVSVKDNCQNSASSKQDTETNDINDNASGSMHEDDELMHSLIEEAQGAANRLKGHYMLLDLNNKNSGTHCMDQLRPFLSTVIDRKPFIEKVFETDDNENEESEDNIDDNSNEQDIVRDTSFIYRKDYHDGRLSGSYMSNNGHQSMCGSSEDDLEDHRRADIRGADKNPSDESEVYFTLSGGQTEGQLVKPSRLKKNSEDSFRLFGATSKSVPSNSNELYINRPLPPIPSNQDGLIQPFAINQNQQMFNNAPVDRFDTILQSNLNQPLEPQNITNFNEQLQHQSFNQMVGLLSEQSRRLPQMPQSSGLSYQPTDQPYYPPRYPPPAANVLGTDKYFNLPHAQSKVINLVDDRFMQATNSTCDVNTHNMLPAVTHEPAISGQLLQHRSNKIAKLEASRRFMSCDESVRRNDNTFIHGINARRDLLNRESSMPTKNFDKFHSISFDSYGNHGNDSNHGNLPGRHDSRYGNELGENEDRSILAAQNSADLINRISRQRILDEEQLRLQIRAAEIESLLVASKSRLAASLNDNQKLQQVIINDRLFLANSAPHPSSASSSSSSAYISGGGKVAIPQQHQNQSRRLKQAMLSNTEMLDTHSIIPINNGDNQSSDSKDNRRMCDNAGDDTNNDEDYDKIDDEDGTICYDEVPSDDMVVSCDDEESREAQDQDDLQLNFQKQYNTDALTNDFRLASSRFSSEDLDDQRSDDQDHPKVSSQERPKPGRLDLKQFDNITDAIRKLSVQPSYKSTDTSHSSQKLSDTSRYPIDENDQVEKQTFFKSRVRRAKNVSRRTKELLDKADSDSYSDDQIINASASASSSSGNRPQKSVESGDKMPFELSSALNPKQKPIPKPARIPIRDNEQLDRALNNTSEDLLSDRQGNHNQQAHHLSSRSMMLNKDYMDNSKDSLELSNKTSSAQSTASASQSISDKPNGLNNQYNPNRPIQQQTQQPQHSNTPPPPTPPNQQHQAPSFSVRHQNLLAKRLHHSRQNHGIAVAPPQLPPVSMSDQATSSTKNLVRQDISSSLDDDTLNSEYDQSPIAQRLLKRVVEHKVSELNSPSDSEHSDNNNDDDSSNGADVTNVAIPGETVNRAGDCVLPINSSIDSSELINSREAAIRQLNEILANKANKRGFIDPTRQPFERQSSTGTEISVTSEVDSRNLNRKDKKKQSRDNEKLEKRRLKEEERQRRQEKKLAAKRSKSGASNGGGSLTSDGIPIFVKKCIEFIELEGLDAEGIYRVPGNRAHVDAFVQKFEENSQVSMVELDIPVNAVATALKDFLSKKMSPIIPLPLMTELTELANIPDKDQRLIALQSLISRLPPQNHRLLKYVFSHFVKVSENHSLNSMDSKNLAICWWPTLLPLHFTDMIMFEQMRPHLEATVQTMIDQFSYIFEYNNC